MAEVTVPASLQSRALPAWFDNAKLGIFLHWGLYSVPAFAPVTHKTIVEILREDPEKAQGQTPYAEWYLNSMRIPGSPTQKHHADTYGANYSYDNFREEFEAGLKNFDPTAWARTFKEAGAGYVVITTKHHDGYLLWPSHTPNPYKERWQSPRDLIGELADAVRAEGMKFGTYYSGGLDWTFEPGPIAKPADMLGCVPNRPDYVNYATTHFKELIDRVQPDVLWNDIGWPGSNEEFFALAEHYYNAVPDGLVNDRWTAPTFMNSLARFAPSAFVINKLAQRMLKNIESMTPPKPPHYDFRTPEYSTLKDAGDDKWEATRGVGHSFGFNAAEGTEFLIPGKDLVQSFADIVAHGGNLLLNLGPRGDSTLCPDQVDRLMVLGNWLNVNGPAIYGTRPAAQPALTSTQGHEVRCTTGADGTLYAMVFDAAAGDAITLKGLPAINTGAVELLGTGAVEAKQADGALALLVPAGAADAHAHTFALKTQ